MIILVNLLFVMSIVLFKQNCLFRFMLANLYKYMEENPNVLILVHTYTCTYPVISYRDVDTLQTL